MRWLVVGLGSMGAAFARRLVSCGHTVVGVDPSTAAREGLAEVVGVTTVPTADAAGEVDVAVVMVLTPEQVVSAMDALLGVPRGIRPLPVFVASTIDPDTARGLSTWDGETLRIIEAPVTGLVQGALDGTLTVMVAGNLVDGDESMLRETLASRVVTFDEYGQPNLAKLLNNCLLAYNAQALTEVLTLGADRGLSPARMMDVLTEGSGGSFAASRLSTLVPDLIDKDVGLLVDAVGALPPVQPGREPVTPIIERARRRLERLGGAQA